MTSLDAIREDIMERVAEILHRAKVYDASPGEIGKDLAALDRFLAHQLAEVARHAEAWLIAPGDVGRPGGRRERRGPARTKTPPR